MTQKLAHRTRVGELSTTRPTDDTLRTVCAGIVRTLFKDQAGKPIELTPGQLEVFATIYGRRYPRVHVMTHTRYGKSLTCALAVLSRALNFPEKWAIVAGNREKAQIIMDYVIAHIFDNEFSYSRFVIDKGESAESIKRYRNKSKLTFRVKPADETGPALYSQIFIHNAKDALGFGAPNVVEDESSLIDDKEHTMVMRMLGDDTDNFLVKIGNPMKRNHFLASYNDPSYYKIDINYMQGVREGRLTLEQVEEMRTQHLFDQLYANKFPAEGQADDEGYDPLLTESEVNNAYVNLKLFGDLRIGVDVSAGGDAYTAITVRGENAAICLFREHTTDMMKIITMIVQYASEFKVRFDDKHVFVDKIGVGQFLVNEMNRMYPGQNFGINVGAPPYLEETMRNKSDVGYKNLKAQASWKMADWVRRGGKLWPKPQFDDLKNIKYKVMSDKKIAIKDKAMMARDGFPSPDVADSLMLTFALPAANEMRRRSAFNDNGVFPNYTEYGV